MMRTLVAMCALTAAVLVARPVDAEDVKPEEFYPLKVGNVWTYSVTGADDKFTIKAAREEKVGNQPCIVLEATVKGNVVATEHVARLKDGLYRFKFNGATVEPPLCFCKLPAKEGQKWKHDFKVGTDNATVEFASAIEEVKVPAGKHEAVVVRGAVKEGANEVTLRSYYAPKVGMVKQEIDLGKMQVVLKLEKFDPAK
jgi:hypothetical protein